MGARRVALFAGSATLVLATLLVSHGLAAAGQYVRVSSDLELYYEDGGSGRPIVFIPGWTATTEYYGQQLAHFSKRYRAISYDPRGQGRSSKTLENNHYAQHGADLRAFMDALALDGAVLVGHSLGCHDAYAYFRAHGTDRVRAFVCLDETPKETVEDAGDWGFFQTIGDLRGFHGGIQHNRLETTREFIQGMVTRPLTEGEHASFVDQLLRTPTSLALQLLCDGAFGDYTAEARFIDGKIPVLNVLADPGWYEGWAESGREWLSKNAPHSEVVVLPGLHLMHWELPGQVNAAVEAFLDRLD